GIGLDVVDAPCFYGDDSPLCAGEVITVDALVELMERPHMVEVTVCHDGDDVTAAGDRRELASEVADPVPRVHQKVTVAAADVPDVREPEGIDVRLHEERDPVAGRRRVEPAIRDGEIGNA